MYTHQPQPDSTSSLLLNQPSGEVTYYNNSDSSDFVTTTSNHSLTSTNASNGNLQSSPLNTGPVNFQQRRGSLQLWQFLIALLDEPISKLVLFTL